MKTQISSLLSNVKQIDIPSRFLLLQILVVIAVILAITM